MSDSGGDVTAGGGHQPGPVYDGAVRSTVEGDPGTVLSSLGLPVPRGPDQGVSQPEVLSSEFPARTLRADFLARLSSGELLHMEYERRGEPGIAQRMLEYRGRILGGHPGPRVRQYVMVLGDGELDTCDDRSIGFALGVQPIYLREQDPAAFLADPSSAPFAALAAGDVETRKQSLVAAMRLILAQGGARTGELLQCAERLAAIRLDPRTIQEAREESGMTEVEAVADWYEQMDVGQELLRRGRVEGEARGRVEGEARGRVEGEADVLEVLLRSRFGDHADIPATAGRLAKSPDTEAAVRAVMTARTIDELRDVDVPAPRRP